MKKILCILLAVIVLFLFCACGTDESAKVPGTDLIQTDIQNSLSEYQAMQGACALKVQDHQLTKSLTEDKTYTAEYNVTAESKYAQFHYIANISYTLYDQGWSMDSCEWNYIDCEVVRYPDEDNLADLEDYYRVQDLENPVFVGNGNSFMVTSLSTADWSPYATGSTECVSTWNYNSYSDSWDYKDTMNYQPGFELTDAFEDTLAGISDFSNFTENGFDVVADNELFSVNATRVELMEDQSFFAEDKILLRFVSGFDVAFYNKDRADNGEGYMIVSAEIFKEPQTSTSPSHDMILYITMVDESWADKPIYSIPIYHYVGE